jgi:hypothetical protein
MSAEVFSTYNIEIYATLTKLTLNLLCYLPFLLHHVFLNASFFPNFFSLTYIRNALFQLCRFFSAVHTLFLKIYHFPYFLVDSYVIMHLNMYI